MTCGQSVWMSRALLLISKEQADAPFAAADTFLFAVMLFVGQPIHQLPCPYGANIRTNRMILLSNNITDNLFWQ